MSELAKALEEWIANCWFSRHCPNCYSDECWTGEYCERCDYPYCMEEVEA